MKTLSLISGTNNLRVGNKVVEFSTFQAKNKAVRKLEKEGYFFKRDITQTDEFAGLCQANQLGLKTFECTILG